MYVICSDVWVDWLLGVRLIFNLSVKQPSPPREQKYAGSILLLCIRSRQGGIFLKK